MNLGTAYVNIKAKADELTRGLALSKADVTRSIKGMQDSVNRLSFRAAQIGLLALSAAAVKMAKDSLDLGRNFEATMKTVQAWSGAAGKELQALTDLARKMGATTEWTGQQSAEALKYLAAAGFSVSQSLAALPSTLDLATAGQVNLGAATDITTDVLTAFKMEVSELSRVNDAFIVTSSNSNTNVEMLGQSFKMAAPTAKLFGFNVEQTAALLGTLANSGIKAEMAGSGLNMVMLRSAKAAKDMGMEGASLIDVLKRMNAEHWNATQIGNAFGARQVKTAGILMANIDTYEKLTQKIYDNQGATQKLAAIMRDSLDVDIKTLISSIEEGLLKVFDLYKGDLREIIQQTTAWIRENDKWLSLRVWDGIKSVGSALEKIWKMISYDPAIIEYGLIGLAIGGKKGAVLIGGMAHMATWANNLGKAMGFAAAGVIEFGEVARANFKELEVLVVLGEKLTSGGSNMFSGAMPSRYEPDVFSGWQDEGRGLSPEEMPSMGPSDAEQEKEYKAAMAFAKKLGEDTYRSYEYTQDQIYTYQLWALDERFKAEEDAVKKTAAASKKAVADEKKLSGDRLQAYRSMYSDMSAAAQENFDITIELLDAQAAEYGELTGDWA
ncbi:MAG: phage tail tape measure protein, partial [Pseudomonadota bacterium]